MFVCSFKTLARAACLANSKPLSLESIDIDICMVFSEMKDLATMGVGLLYGMNPETNKTGRFIAVDITLGEN